MRTCEANIADPYEDLGAWVYSPCGKPAIQVYNEDRGRWEYYCKQHLEELEDVYDVGRSYITVLRRKGRKQYLWTQTE
jgi:hypothetical protein